MPPSLLCETVTGRTTADLIAARDAAAGVDLVELRLDGVADLDVARALDGRRTPVIVTCRPQREGGRFVGAEEERHSILERALALGAEYIDIESRAGFDDLVQRHPARAVLSFHDFAGVPPDLETRVRAMRATGAAVIKVAVAAARLTDTLPLVDIGMEGDAVVIGMGDAGVPSRLLATRFGSRWTYAGSGIAPGQIPTARMLEEFRFRTIGPRTMLFGVAGTDALNSPRLAAQNTAFAAASVDAVCVPLPTDDMSDVRTFAEALGIRLELPPTTYRLPPTDYQLPTR
jgi:3-dehydroquinate dehydratase/shikimate dehydrogenase